ncbi:TPA: hypothetical protein ACGSH4_004461, partial [Escherichia coli]
FSSGAGRTSDGNGSHASTLKSPSYTKSVSWQHHQVCKLIVELLYIQLLRELYPDQQECGFFPADCHFFLE